VELVNVVSAAQMYDAVMQHIHGQDVFISVAAVADYRPKQTARQKIKKSEQSLLLELVPNKDILAEVARLPQPPFCVGFAAESDDLLQHAEAKRRNKGVPLLVANLIAESMGRDDASVVLLDDAGSHPIPGAGKDQIARQLLQHIAVMLDSPNRKICQ
jgi:phosphopantothenoylcysteine decarboxylase/phosphopantothenate--cysteine ligase